ncbi:MAG: peptidoglycan-binding protein [Proteobacteria bacterium]|nr:peptidoglycan-binding protein [Pseudomonadota bacterium]
MATGQDLYNLAMLHKGEKYVNVLVPKDNPNWKGPWDCAELASWAVFQTAGVLYGCNNDDANPAVADAYSGAWVRDASSGKLGTTTQDAANNMAGVILIRRPPTPGAMGHVAISSGKGTTVEAAGVNLGVREGAINGRLWHFFALIPQLTYTATAFMAKPKKLPMLLELKDPLMAGDLVKQIQQALSQKGVDPGVMDGKYGPHTAAAVEAFQMMNRLVSDGIVGPATAKKLGVDWPDPV